MKRVFMALVILAAWLFAVSVQADKVEIKVEKTANEIRILQHTVVELESMKTLATFPPLPAGINLSNEEILTVYKAGVVEKKAEERFEIKALFPIPVILDTTSSFRIKLENGQWAVNPLSRGEFGTFSIFFSLCALALAVMLIAVSVRDRINIKKRKTKEIILFYAACMFATALIVASQEFGATDPFYLWTMVMIALFVGCVICLFVLPSVICLTLIAVIIVALLVLFGASDSLVIWQYLILLAGTEVLSFLLGEGIFRWQNRRCLRIRTSPPQWVQNKHGD